MSREILFKRNAVRECLRAGRRRIHRLVVMEGADLRDAQDILAEAQRRKVPVASLDRKAFNLAVHGERHQNLLLEVGAFVYADLEDVLINAQRAGEAPLILVLDLLQDPRNVGAILRTADALGAHGVVFQERRGCEITPTVVNTAAGATEHLPIAQVTNLAEALRRLKQREIWLAGLDLGPDSQPIESVDLNLPLALVVGNEGSGLRRLVRDLCDFRVRLPMHGRVQSLNAAVAGSLALYAARLARGGGATPRPPAPR